MQRSSMRSRSGPRRPTCRPRFARVTGGYYTRTAESQQYPVHCRCPALPGEALPPTPQDGRPVRGEEVMLDGNELARRTRFFSLGTVEVSPDGRLLVYASDYVGNERFTLRVKDLMTGETAPDEIPDTYYGCAWSADSSALYYITVDQAWRPYRIWRHLIGTPATQDVIVSKDTTRNSWSASGSHAVSATCSYPLPASSPARCGCGMPAGRGGRVLYRAAAAAGH